MSVTAKPLIQARHAANVLTTEYSVPAGTRTIIDKFTATNTDSAARTISVHLVQSAGVANATNLIVSAFSLAAGSSQDFSILQNQILGPNDFVSVVASAASVVVIRMSGRECT